MLKSEIPEKFTIPFADQAGGSFITYPIPVDSQIGSADGRASLQTGFVPLNFNPIDAGGVPPFGQDFNGILKQITAWNRWQCAGATVPYDAAFQVEIGGYPEGAIVGSLTENGVFYISTVDDNLSVPGASSTWVRYTVVPPSSQLVTASTTLNLTANQLRIGLRRVSGVAAMTINLYASQVVDTECVIQDLIGNLFNFPATVVPPAGATISGLSTFIMREDRMTARFYRYSSTVYGVEVS